MQYRAKVNFSGTVSMCVGEVRDIADESIAKDLIRAGYIEEIQPADKDTAKAKSNKKEGAKK